MSETGREKGSSRHAVRDLVYIAMFAALIAVCSVISIPLGEVPFTLQTFGVCLAAAMLGWKRGTLSVIIYILLGAVGLPVFAGLKGGVGVLAGPTGGYIVGFILTALVVGFAAQRSDRRALPLAFSMAVGVLLCYAVGAVWFMSVTRRGILEALTLCILPYLLPDSVKIAAAVLLTNRLSKVIKM